MKQYFNNIQDNLIYFPIPNTNTFNTIQLNQMKNKILENKGHELKLS